jgi:hypothetical protein
MFAESEPFLLEPVMPGLLDRRCSSHRLLCSLLAVLMAASPAPLVAQAPATTAGDEAAPLDTSFALPDACFVVAARPSQVLKSPAFELLPIEVVQAAMVQQTGIDPLSADQVLLSVVPPAQGPPGYALHAKFSAPVTLKLDKLPMALQERQVGARTVLKGPGENPLEPGLFLPDDRTLVAFDDFSAAKLPAAADVQAGPLMAKFKEAYRGDDLLAMLDLEPLRPLINVGLMQAPVPPEFAEFTQIPNLVKAIELRLNLSRPGVSELVVNANNEADAFRLMRMYDQARAQAAQQVAAQSKLMLTSDDPVEQAAGRYMERMTNYWNEQTNLTHEGAQIILFRTEGAGNSRNQLASAAVIGVLVALLLPAVQAAREAARRNMSMNNMKQILLGLLLNESARGSMPAYANFSADGKPLLSWRVHILPYVEQQALYQQFHLDEPWDSPHNKALIPQMPAIFLDPSSGRSATDGLTHYLGVKGEGRFFDGTSEGRKLTDLTDGTANTIAVVQVNDDRAVVWTKPEDWETNDAAPLVGLGALHPGIFLAGFADGHVTAVSTMIDVNALKAMLTIAGGEVTPRP